MKKEIILLIIISQVLSCGMPSQEELSMMAKEVNKNYYPSSFSVNEETITLETKFTKQQIASYHLIQLKQRLLIYELSKNEISLKKFIFHQFLEEDKTMNSSLFDEKIINEIFEEYHKFPLKLEFEKYVRDIPGVPKESIQIWLTPAM